MPTTKAAIDNTPASPAKKPYKFSRDFHAHDLTKKIPYNIFSGLVLEEVLANPDPVLQLTGAKGIVVYEDMLMHPTIASHWKLREACVTGLDWEWISPTEDDEDKKRTEQIKDIFENLGGYYVGNKYVEGMSALYQPIMDARAKGYAIGQVMWNTSQGTIADIRGELPQAFEFRDAENPSRPAGGYWVGDDLFYRPAPNARSIPAPPFKFLHFCNKGKYRNPWGEGEFRPLYWPWWFGFVNALVFYTNFIDKWSNPTVLADVPLALWDDKEFTDALLSVISGIQQDYAAVVPRDPDGHDMVRVLETNRSSSQNVFENYIDAMDRWIALVLVGQVLATMESQYGTRAQATVQDLVRFDILKDDCDFVSRQVRQPIYWQYDVLYGRRDDNKYPKLKLKYEKGEDLDKAAERDREMSKFYDIGVNYAREKYGHPAPAAGEPVMRERSPVQAFDQEDAEFRNNGRPPAPGNQEPEQATGASVDILADPAGVAEPDRERYSANSIKYRKLILDKLDGIKAKHGIGGNSHGV